tara:strand:- start:919 stop:1527 length:609 start_codon:yes stop_codon:yes gene_type:complete
MADELDLVTLRKNAAAKAFASEEEEGKAIADELSDDPVEADAQAAEWLANQPTPLIKGEVWGDDMAVLQAEREDEIGLTPEEMQAQRRYKLDEDPKTSWADRMGDTMEKMPNYYPLRQTIEAKYPGLDVGYGRAWDDQDNRILDEQALQYLRPDVADALRALLKEEIKDRATTSEMREVRNDMEAADRWFPEETGYEEEEDE